MPHGHPLITVHNVLVATKVYAIVSLLELEFLISFAMDPIFIFIQSS